MPAERERDESMNCLFEVGTHSQAPVRQASFPVGILIVISGWYFFLFPGTVVLLKEDQRGSEILA